VCYLGKEKRGSKKIDVLIGEHLFVGEDLLAGEDLLVDKVICPRGACPVELSNRLSALQRCNILVCIGKFGRPAVSTTK